jgi:hypothetical protein
MFKKKNDTYGVYVKADGTLGRGRLAFPTPGRHNTAALPPTLPEPDFIDPTTGAVVPAGLRDAPPTSGLKVRLSHPLNRNTWVNPATGLTELDTRDDVTLLYTSNCAEPSEFSEIAGAGANVVPNGDFSQGTSGWIMGATGSSNGVPHSTAAGTLTAAGGKALITISDPGSHDVTAKRKSRHLKSTSYVCFWVCF